MVNSKTTDPKVFPRPKVSTVTTPQDQVIVHVLGVDQITPESFRVTLQAQVTLAGGRGAEGLPVGFFLNSILVGKTACDEFGVADLALTIAWAALQQDKTLTVKVKGMEQAAPVKWDVPKSPMELEAEERERREAAERERLRPTLEELLKNMVNIPAGTFWMGQTDEEQTLLRQKNWWNDHFNSERPRHQVKLAAFAIGKYPVTQAQWQAVMGSNPSQFQGADRPVENVSWDDAQEFCRRLNAVVGAGSNPPLLFRLPTEAEWECTCRAGTQTIWPFGNDPTQLRNYAWYNENSGSQTHPVGQLKPNAWGLYEMLGNVWELCQDIWHQTYQGAPADGSAWLSSGSKRVIRGGCWYNVLSIEVCPAERSLSGWPTERHRSVGFRLVRTPA